MVAEQHHLAGIGMDGHCGIVAVEVARAVGPVRPVGLGEGVGGRAGVAVEAHIHQQDEVIISVDARFGRPAGVGAVADAGVGVGMVVQGKPWAGDGLLEALEGILRDGLFKIDDAVEEGHRLV